MCYFSFFSQLGFKKKIKSVHCIISIMIAVELGDIGGSGSKNEMGSYAQNHAVAVD